MKQKTTTLTFNQLKKLVMESEETNIQNNGVKYFVKYYEADCEEDVYNEGVVGGTTSFWTNEDNPVKGEFDSIEDVLKAVCKKNYYDYKKEYWVFDDYSGLFYTDLLVDEGNSQASDNDIEEWKSGKRQLWNCRIHVKIMKRTPAIELDDSETAEWEH